jgi:molybdopterin synthase catalytic subunit
MSGDGSRFSITNAPLDLPVLMSAVGGDDGTNGAVVTFLGLVRATNQGRRVVRLEYEAYEPLGLRGLKRIADEVGDRWPSVRLGIHHRTGHVPLGEASVVIVSVSPHRAEAYAASRYAIERVKQILPIWKHEHFEDGHVWIEGATADPDDERARGLALERACASR